MKTPHDKLVIGFGELRDSRLNRPLVIAEAKGVFFIDENGKEIIDGYASFYCNSLGQGDPEIIEAMVEQMRASTQVVTAEYRTAPVVLELAEKLGELVPLRDPHIYFTTSGSEANDSIIKFAWCANRIKGEPRRRKIISRFGSYHGATIATAGTGGGKQLFEQFGVPLQDMIHVSQPDYFNNRLAGETKDEFVARLAHELDQAVQAAGPETVAGFMAEPISYSCGFFPPPDGYWRAMQDVLHRYGIPLFIDEIVTNFGRTNQLFGSQTYDIDATCLAIGKSLSSGYGPIAGVAMSGEFYEELERSSLATGGFRHAGTFAGHPTCAAAALRVLQLYEERNVMQHINEMTVVLEKLLHPYRDHPLVLDVRHVGLGAAIQLSPAGQPGNEGRALSDLCFDEGLLARPVGDSLVLAPPLSITAEELGLLFDRLAAAMARYEANRQQCNQEIRVNQSSL